MAIKRGSYRPAKLADLDPEPERPIDEVIAEVEAVARMQAANPKMSLLQALNIVQGRI